MGNDHLMMGHNGSKSRARRFALLAALACVLATGCVERRVLIRSDPPGALVYVDDHEVGITPVSISPVYYGERKIRLVKDGRETKTVLQPLPPPWYEVPPLDFFSENVVPGTLHDTRTLDFKLDPQGVVPKEELLSRAECLRRGTPSVAGVATPGYRVNPPNSRPVYVPPGSNGPVVPAPMATPSPGVAPAGPPPSAPSYPPGPGTQPGVGSQPYFPLPSGR